MTGRELDQLSDDQLRHRAPEVAVYARVTAEHKLRIIRALKAHDAVVAMTGDGVRSEKITGGGFLGTMFLTGALTAGVAFAVYFHALKSQPVEVARGSAFAVLVFAELFRAFGARSETKPLWRISLFTNLKLILVVALSFGLQVWSQHSATFGNFLRVRYMPLADCLLLLAVGAIPLLVLEIVKVVRSGLADRE